MEVDKEVVKETEIVQEVKEVEKEDEYAYLNLPGFSSEKFKIEIRNLPKYYGMNELKKLLNVKLDLNSCKIKTPRPGSIFAYVCFRSEEEKDAAILKLDGYEWKNKKLTASIAKPAPDPLVKRRNEEASANDAGQPKRFKTLEESTTDFVHLAYEDQLIEKQKSIEDLLKRFGNGVWKDYPCHREFIESQRKLYNGLPCELKPIKRSPLIDGYRNKCEFTVGRDSDGERVVGFRVGSYCSGRTDVSSVYHLRHISEKMKLAVKLFEKFVRNSKLDVFDPEPQTGNFRQLCVREAHGSGQIMVIVGIHPQALTAEEIAQFKKEVIDYYNEGEGKELNVTSLWYQELTKKMSGQMCNAVHLNGTTHITDSIQGLNFRISPAAFFQINTPCAETLYQCAIDFGAPTDKTTVLDICCGTGTIGLCFAKHSKQILGVEIIPEAIADAEFNAKENNIENCKFYAGSAEDLISSLMRQANVMDGEEVLAIVDPPRAGLHNKSVLQLRNSRHLNRLVYMSCSPDKAMKNWYDLARPCSKTMRGMPFLPKMAIAVDMFPHTHHVELIILFEREVFVDDEEEEVKKVEEAVVVDETVKESVVVDETVKELQEVVEDMGKSSTE